MSRLTTFPRAAAALAVTCALSVAAVGPAAAKPSEPVGNSNLYVQGVVTNLPANVPAPPVLGSVSYVVADLDTGDILAAKAAHQRLRPASTLKILTAVTLLPKLPPQRVYKAVFDDANVEGSRVGIVPDALYTVHNLFEGMFLLSGNDAANALANANGGVAATVAEMNQTAHRLGALDTTAVNPSGLDADGQYTSAYDLALLGRTGMQRSDFRTYVSTVRSRFPGKMPPVGKPRASFEIYTTDRLLLNYPGAIGVKNGFTSLARNTFVGAATRGGRSLIVSVMRTGPTSWREAAALLDWGFTNGTRANPVGSLEAPAIDSLLATPPPDPALGGGASAAAAEVPAPAVSRLAEAPKTSGAGFGGPVRTAGWIGLALLAAVATLRARVLLLRRRRAARPVRR